MCTTLLYLASHFRHAKSKLLQTVVLKDRSFYKIWSSTPVWLALKQLTKKDKQYLVGLHHPWQALWWTCALLIYYPSYLFGLYKPKSLGTQCDCAETIAGTVPCIHTQKYYICSQWFNRIVEGAKGDNYVLVGVSNPLALSCIDKAHDLFRV